MTTVNDTVNGRIKTAIYLLLQRDTTFVGRLIQQANDVVNAAIGIDYKGFSGRISFSMTGNVLSSVGIKA